MKKVISTMLIIAMVFSFTSIQAFATDVSSTDVSSEDMSTILQTIDGKTWKNGDSAIVNGKYEIDCKISASPSSGTLASTLTTSSKKITVSTVFSIKILGTYTNLCTLNHIAYATYTGTQVKIYNANSTCSMSLTNYSSELELSTYTDSYASVASSYVTYYLYKGGIYFGLVNSAISVLPDGSYSYTTSDGVV